MKKLIAIAVFALPFCFHAKAQSTFNAGGGSAVVGGISHEWSVGEMVLVHTAKAGSIVITQGLLQPSKAAGANGLDASQFVLDHVQVYPNPTENIFYVEANFQTAGDVFCALYDMSGKMVENRKISVDNQPVKIPFNISSLAGGMYSLTIAFDAGEKGSSKAVYKIEKTN